MTDEKNGEKANRPALTQENGKEPYESRAVTDETTHDQVTEEQWQKRNGKNRQQRISDRQQRISDRRKGKELGDRLGVPEEKEKGK